MLRRLDTIDAAGPVVAEKAMAWRSVVFDC